jgi:hypothetical protein
MWAQFAPQSNSRAGVSYNPKNTMNYPPFPLSRLFYLRWVAAFLVAFPIVWVMPASAQPPDNPTGTAAPTATPPVLVPPPAVTTPARPCRRRLVRGQCLRLRATFFEQDRRLRYGFTDFLEAALDGAGNTINSSIRNPGFDTNAIVAPTPDQLPGQLTINNTNSDSSDFLRGAFTANGQVGSGLTITNVNRDSGSPQTGDISISGSVTVQNPDGTTRVQTINIQNGRYRAGVSSRGNLFRGTIEITDPNNRDQTILIDVPQTRITDAEADQDRVINRPATLSIGRPVDR